MTNATPYEIIMAPFTVWIAPTGTAFPDVDTAPGAGWTLLGTSGDENYAENGVTVEHDESISLFRSLGRTGARKASRTQEDLKISLELADLTLEQYRRALSDNAITTVAAGVGTPGYKKLGLSKGVDVALYALLVRGPSPYMADGAAQYEVPICFQSGKPKPVMKKSDAAVLALEFTALEDATAASADERFGRLVAQTAPAN